MRIIAGKYRSRILKTNPSMDTRPTLDQVKESFFSMIGGSFNQGIVLDLFSGSGAIGLECISRGFDKAICIDNNYQAVNIIKENIKALKCDNQVQVYQYDYKKALNTLQDRFDLIYIDPPYAKKDYYTNSIELILKNNLLNDNGLIACECDENLDLNIADLDLQLWKEKKYRHNKIYIFKGEDYEE